MVHLTSITILRRQSFSLPSFLFSFITLISVSLSPFQCRAGGDTTKLFFEFNRPELTTTTRSVVDSLLYADAINVRSTLLIRGYADYVGTDAYNKNLSKQRADNVVAYLSEMGIPGQNIKMVTGVGEVSRSVQGAGGYAGDRRVDLVILNSPSLKAATVRGGTVAVKPPASFPSIDTLSVGQTFVLRNILFFQGRHTIVPSSLSVLEDLLHFLQAYPKVKIQIEGHICCMRANSDALDEDVKETDLGKNTPGYSPYSLSYNRALNISRYLVEKKISPERLKCKGFGRSRPLIPVERSPQDEALNRRVEIRILAK